MPEFLGTHHVGLTVRSMEASRRFYVEVLGFTEVFSRNPKAEYVGALTGHPGVDLHQCVVALPGTGVCLEIMEYRGIDAHPVDTDNANPGTAHLCFLVDDVDAIYARLKAAGVGSVSEPVTPTVGPNAGGRAVYLIDPDGHRVELLQSSMSFVEYGEGTQAR